MKFKEGFDYQKLRENLHFT